VFGRRCPNDEFGDPSFIVRLIIAVFVSLAAADLALISAEENWKSHRPMRAASSGSNRTLPAEPMLVVDAAKGDDNNAGAQAVPLRTVQPAVIRAMPGTTVVLRGGA